MKRIIVALCLLAGVVGAEDIDLRSYEEKNPPPKNTELKAAENCFMWVCEQTGATNKLGFGELIGELLPIAQVNPVRFEALYKAANLADAAGKRYNPQWWDSCVRHAEIPDEYNTFIQAAIALGATSAP